MDKFIQARVRALHNARKRYNEASSCEDYEVLVRLTASMPHRSLDEFTDALSQCKSCCPDGYCKMCGCNYRTKIVLSEFKCQLGKFE